MLKVLFSLLTAFCLAIVAVQPIMAEIDPETIVAAWLCDEGKGKILKDSSGNGHDGKFVKKEGWTKEGKFGNALEFTGDHGNNVEVPHDDSLTLKEWTITAWVKQEQTPEWSVVLVKDPANGLQNYALDMNKEGRVFSEITCAAKWSDCGSKTVVRDEEWHFLAASYDGKKLHIYVDNVHEGEQAFCAGDVNEAPITIGDRKDSSQPIKGIIDDIGLFSVALTEKDMKPLMDEGFPVLLSVDPASKLTTSWGHIKTYY